MPRSKAPRAKRRTWRQLWEVRNRADRLGDYRCTASERHVLNDLLDEGWEVLNRGWPDFLAVRGDEVRLIEVKAHRHDHPSEAQRAMFRVLAEKLGLKVEVVLPGGKPQ